jgi:hypothetical protein
VETKQQKRATVVEVSDTPEGEAQEPKIVEVTESELEDDETRPVASGEADDGVHKRMPKSGNDEN